MKKRKKLWIESGLNHLMILFQNIPWIFTFQFFFNWCIMYFKNEIGNLCTYEKKICHKLHNPRRPRGLLAEGSLCLIRFYWKTCMYIKEMCHFLQITYATALHKNLFLNTDAWKERNCVVFLSKFIPSGNHKTLSTELKVGSFRLYLCKVCGNSSLLSL